MGVIKWLSSQFRAQMFALNHDTLSDFYLSPWQKNHNLLPVLLLRILLFLISLFTFISSIVLDSVRTSWPIYMTNWIVCMQLVTTGFAVAVSAKFYFTKTVVISFNLSWYVKTYWFLVNTYSAVAILNSTYHYCLLFIPELLDSLLVDVMTHAINSVDVILLLLSSRTPSRLLHFYQPVSFNLVYIMFTFIFYLSGGTHPDGFPWIYPIINWTDPGPTLKTILIIWMCLIVIHLMIVLLAAGRDFISKKIRGTPV